MKYNIGTNYSMCVSEHSVIAGMQIEYTDVLTITSFPFVVHEKSYHLHYTVDQEIFTLELRHAWRLYQFACSSLHRYSLCVEPVTPSVSWITW